MFESTQAQAPCLPVCAKGTCLTSDQPVLQIRNLSVRYGARYAFRDISVDIQPCSVTAWIGPSGSGKSTFLSCFNRLIDLYPECHASGSIVWGGMEILDRSLELRSLRTKIGMVFQKPNPFPTSIKKNLTMPLKEHKRLKNMDEVVEKSLKEVGLWNEVKDRLNAPALGLSGGQQQRLCIARTLALEPEVILFDEPCSALDPLSSTVIEELIHGLRNRCSVMIVTHNLAQARRIADDIGVFWTVEEGYGRLVEFGSAQQIFEAPKVAQTDSYIRGKVG